MTKKQLKIELEKAHNEIESLKSDVKYLEEQRTQLVEEKEEIFKNVKKRAMDKVESMCNIEYIDNATDEAFLKLSENLIKSLKGVTDKIIAVGRWLIIARCFADRHTRDLSKLFGAALVSIQAARPFDRKLAGLFIKIIALLVKHTLVGYACLRRSCRNR